MSIAVSAVVHPSKLLFALKIGMSIFVALIGVLVVFGGVGNLNSVSAIVFAIVSISAASLMFALGCQTGKSLHIDISGAGQIRLTEYRESISSQVINNVNLTSESGELVQLMAHSTLWQHLLLLRLKSNDQRVRVVPILPDCVNADSFRTLAVACRWIAAHNGSDDHKHL